MPLPSATCSIDSLSSASIIRGNNVGIFGRVRNTTTKKQRFNVRFSAVSNCDSSQWLIAESVIRFNAGETKLISVSWPTPIGACVGVYTITLDVEYGSAVIISDTEPLSVTAS